MPLPDTSLDITGGCSCGAVRYLIAISEVSSRIPNPFTPSEYGICMPSVIACHCNDCRRATGSGLPNVIIQIPAPLITVSAMSPSSAEESHQNSGRILDVLSPGYDAAAADASRPPYVPATDLLRALPGTEKTWLRFFHSGNCGASKSRSFCGRCGTQVCYHLELTPEHTYNGVMPNGWSDLFDVYLGSVDRQFLEKDWLLPACDLQFKHGTPLSKQVSATAKIFKDIPKMQEWDDVVVEEELAELAR
ncbi:hypothetical protein HJFPF1_06619 [Paramyrothecium foliicola]|nr:hypothetical protein HJFPF1_06619 [Paramyrothecium foliicola]